MKRTGERRAGRRIELVDHSAFRRGAQEAHAA
ncbi:hypothetical protein BDSB_13500 [Burkholderia dolosa PC543]|nr:hypothetical protein BDSB_13500 [Burkholderia dolosa PC543]